MYNLLFLFFVAACPMFDADVIVPFSGNNCNITCPVNTEIEYVCEDRMTGRATCMDTSTWNQTCAPLGK